MIFSSEPGVWSLPVVIDEELVDNIPQLCFRLQYDVIQAFRLECLDK